MMKSVVYHDGQVAHRNSQRVTDSRRAITPAFARAYRARGGGNVEALSMDSHRLAGFTNSPCPLGGGDPGTYHCARTGRSGFALQLTRPHDQG